jgi:hypothetical protein
MSESGAAEGKIPYVTAAVIEINTNGQPTPQDVYITLNGTVQYVNRGVRNRRVRLWTRGRKEHADVDLFVPARSATTVIVDPQAAEDGECQYEILGGSFASSEAELAEAGIQDGNAQVGNVTDAAAGGTIKIGPTPKPKYIVVTLIQQVE